MPTHEPRDDDWPWSQVIYEGLMSGFAAGFVRTHDYDLALGLVLFVVMHRSYQILHAIRGRNAN